MGSEHQGDSPGICSQTDAGPVSGTSSSHDCYQPVTPGLSGDALRDQMNTYEDDRCHIPSIAEKKKRISRITSGGLRQFSMIVCKKVEAKIRTTYNEVADDIVAELLEAESNTGSNVLDVKNIHRRVYDALNVLLAINIIAKEKKEIRWIGFPDKRTDIKRLMDQRMNLVNRIQRKLNHLRELEDQYADLRNLMLRNRQICTQGTVTTGEITLPFIMVQTRPQATVEIEISEDMRLVHFDFNGTPFQLHTDAQVLKAMRCSKVPEPKHIPSRFCSPSITNRGNKVFGSIKQRQ